MHARIRLSQFFAMLTLFALTAFSLYADPSTNNTKERTPKAPSSKIRHATSLEVLAAYYLGTAKGYTVNNGFAPISYAVVSNLPHQTNEDPGRTLGSTWGGAEGKVLIKHTIAIPMLQGGGMLTKGNNLAVKLAGELSPVSMNARAVATLTPIAFLNVGVGAQLGSGWPFVAFNGLGRNLSGTNYDEPLEEPFSGLVYKLWAEGTFQFDLGAVIPGDWTHVLLSATVSVGLYGNTGVGDDVAWQYEADKGENFNGAKMWNTFIVAYQMPIPVLKVVGLYIDTEGYIDSANRNRSPVAANGWGSDFTFVHFGPMCYLQLAKRDSLMLLFQFQNERKYTSETIGNRYFGFREYESTYVYFRRLVFVYTHAF